MNGELRLFNRQSTRRIDTRELRRIARHLLCELLKLSDFDLTIHLINATEMAALNETHLHHQGSTDVITLDFSGEPSGPLIGELFVCMDEALIQSKRFRTDWRAELIRYVIHGTLHLRGFDDLKAAARRKMKLEESRLLKNLTARFDLSKLARKPRLTR